MPQFPDNLEPLLAGYVDGTLSKDELAQVEAYLDQQPELRDELQRMMLDSEYLRMLPQARLPQDISDSVGSQLEREMLLSDAGAPTRAAQQRFGLPGLAVAAMVLVGAGIGVLAFQILGSERQLLPALASREVVGRGEGASTTARTGDEALADASPPERSFGAPAPAIIAAAPSTIDGPMALESLPAAIEDEVIARVDLSEVADQPVVLVIESADLGGADRQVRGFLMDNGYAYLSSDDAHLAPDALARSLRSGKFGTSATGGTSPDVPGAITSNVAPPNAIGSAIEMKREGHESTILLARRVDLAAVRQLQSQLNGQASMASPSADRDAFDRLRALQQQKQRAAIYTASTGALKLKQMVVAQSGQPSQAKPVEDPAGAAGAAGEAGEAGAANAAREPGTQVAATPPAPTTPAAPGVSANVPIGGMDTAASIPAPDAKSAPRLIRPGDVLSISLRADAQMQVNVHAPVQVIVDADGFIDVPDRGVYQVRGLTAQQVAAALSGANDPAAPSAFAVVIQDAQAEASKARDDATTSAPTTAPSAVPALPATVPPATRPASIAEQDEARKDDRVDLIIVVKPLAPSAPDVSGGPTTTPVK